MFYYMNLVVNYLLNMNLLCNISTIKCFTFLRILNIRLILLQFWDNYTHGTDQANVNDRFICKCMIIYCGELFFIHL